MLGNRYGRGRKAFLLMSALATGVLAPGAAQIAMAADQTAAADVEEIVVTGSRIVRDGFEAPTPITVLNIEEINSVAAINFADFAAKVPTLAGSFNSHTGGQSTGDGQAGTNSLNLRSMGPNRTLVLLDGIRVTPNSATGFYSTGGTVDINSFPDSLISRVDVVTGGATAAYGSGALSGVVNMVLDKTYTGIKGSVTGGITTYGDDPQYAISLTGGTPFAGGRGHFLLSGSHHYTAGVPDGKGREWVYDVWGRITNPAYTATNGQPFYLHLPHVGSAQYTPGGVITTGPLKGIAFGAGGEPRPYNYGAINDGLNMQGGDWQLSAGQVSGTWSPDSSLDVRVSRQNIFTRLSYDVTDSIQVYAQFMNAYGSTLAYSRYNQRVLPIARDNPFVPEAIAARMTALGLTSFQLGIWATDADRYGSSVRRHFNQYLAGANGSFDVAGSSWSWELFATRSTSRSSVRSFNTFTVPLLNAAVDAVRNANGAIVCRVNNDANPANDMPGCVPLNIIGTGVMSPAALNYVRGTESHMNQYMMLDQVAATVSGEPFSTWAGPVSLAVGIEYFENTATGFADQTSIDLNRIAGNFNPTNGEYNTQEAFAETVVPLASNMEMAQALDVNAGVRVSDFSTSGLVTTWKVGVTYSPVQDIRFRATRSRDTRSPNMGELFARGLLSFFNARDPFKPAGTPAAVTPQVSVGNPTLAPERANTTGIGVVYQSSWLPGFSASFDYYEIDAFVSISSQGAQATVDRCFEGVQAYCDNIERDANNNISRVYLRPANSGGAVQEGYDIEASYRMPLADLFEGAGGSVTLRGLVTHITTQTSTSPDGVVSNNTAPPWRYSATLTYDSDLITTSLTGRGVGEKLINGVWTECTSGCPAAVPPFYTVNDNTIDPQFYMDASFTYHLPTEGGYSADFFLTVENLTNEHPPGIAVIGSLTDIGNPLGRIFRGGVRFRR